MKRILSISFVVLANMILLAHAIIPHHHHDGVAMEWLQHDCQYHHQHGREDHQQEDNSDDCVLKVVLSRLNISNREEEGERHFIPDNFGADLYSPSFSLFSPILTATAVNYQPYIVRVYGQSQFYTVGLRAPPCC